ncbi:hypothetical protein CTA1_12403 [Colletotrichum tanaceti]|uniref:Uncharacterized protein n=1 Tax=Colletotrichum tanaceti TaxID=1306861 RepID=A0A4U6XCM2_9PEZI|nr:hypothetical protein CTA1_12403 [Colletotrichum tanaceti]
MLTRPSLVLATLLSTAVAVSAERSASGVTTEIDVDFDTQKHPFVYDLPTTSPDPPNQKDDVPAEALEGTRHDINNGAVVARTETTIITTTTTTTTTQQSSAGRRRARPPGPEAAAGYRGLLLTTILVCLVAFGIGTVLGWIWPDGLRSEW